MTERIDPRRQPAGAGAVRRAQREPQAHRARDRREVHSRGNELTIVGPRPIGVALARALARAALRHGPSGLADRRRRHRPRRGVLRGDPAPSCSDVFHDTILVGGRARAHRRPRAWRRSATSTPSASTTSSSASARPAPARPTWRWRMAVRALLEKRGQAHRPGPAGGRGGREARLPARHLAEKVNPYLRPLYDALHDMMDFEKARPARRARASSRWRRSPSCAAAR